MRLFRMGNIREDGIRGKPSATLWNDILIANDADITARGFLADGQRGYKYIKEEKADKENAESFLEAHLCSLPFIYSSHIVARNCYDSFTQRMVYIEI